MMETNDSRGEVQAAVGADKTERLWSRDYVFDIGVNFLIYIVHFQLMLWSTSYAIANWHVSIGTAGLASGIFIVGALVARIPAGRYIDYIGRRRMFLGGTAMFFLMVLLYRVAPDPNSFMAVRFVHGLAFGTSSTAASTVVAALVPMKRMGTGIGYFTLGVTVASAIGPYAAIRFVHGGMFESAMYFAIVVAAVILALSIFMKVPERKVSQREREELKHFAFSDFFARKSLAIAFVAMIGGICYSTVLSFLGEYAGSLHLTIGGTWFFICFAFTSIFSRPATGWLLDHKGGSIVIYPALIALAISMLVIAFARTDAALLMGGLILGIGYGTITAACHALSIHCASARQIGVATSTYFVLLDLGIGVGPYLLGNLVNTYGFSAVYICAAVFAIFGIGFYYLELGRKSRFTPYRMEQDREMKLKEAMAHK